MDSSKAPSAVFSPSPTPCCNSSLMNFQRAEGGTREVVIIAPVFGGLLSLLLTSASRQLVSNHPFAFLFEDVRAPLQEQHPEDKITELGVFHLAIQDVSRAV